MIDDLMYFRRLCFECFIYTHSFGIQDVSLLKQYESRFAIRYTFLRSGLRECVVGGCFGDICVLSGPTGDFNRISSPTSLHRRHRSPSLLHQSDLGSLSGSRGREFHISIFTNYLIHSKPKLPLPLVSTAHLCTGLYHRHSSSITHVPDQRGRIGLPRSLEEYVVCG